MRSAAIETQEPADPDVPDVPAVKTAAAPASGRRLFALALIALGVAMLAVNLGLLAPDAQRLLFRFWPAGVIALGLALIGMGDSVWTSAMTPFSVERGEAQEADLLISAGTADVHLESATAAGQLATGELPWPTGPKVDLYEHHTTLRLEPHVGLPSLGRTRWSAALATDLPWRLNLRSSTGILDLDLRELSPGAVRVRSTFGDVNLDLPQSGGAELDIRLVFGDLTIRVPDGLGVKVTFSTGPLAEVERDERRFISLGLREIGTPLYTVAAQRCTLAVWLGTGRLRLQ